jgi:DNA-binding XRE family transcriptional regulator
VTVGPTDLTQQIWFDTVPPIGRARSPPQGRRCARYVRVKGKRKVILEETDYQALLCKADLWEPELPAPDVSGNYPAMEALAVLQARDILRARRKLGLSQAELARRAGIRPETLNRIEQGRNKPSVPTIAKIDRALKAAERGSR